MSSASLGSAPHPGPLPASGAGKGCNLSRDDPATAIRGTATAFPRPAHGEISVSLNSLLTGNFSRFNREFGTENSRRRKAARKRTTGTYVLVMFHIKRSGQKFL